MLNRIIYYYKKERKLLTYFLVSSFIVTALDLYGPIVVQDLVDKSIPEKNIGDFFKFSFLLLIIYVGRFVISLYSSSKGQLMGNKIKFRMRNNLIKKILNQPTKIFFERDKGDFISRITGDLENTSSLLYRGLEDFLFSVLSILGAIILMLKFNVKLTLISLIPLPLIIYFTVIQNKKLKVGYINVRKESSLLTSNIHDTLKNIFFVKDNFLEKNRCEKFITANKKLLEVEKKNIFNLSTLMSGINFYNQITQLIIIFVGGYLHIKGEISFGIILSFILLTSRFRIYLMRLIGLIDIFQRGMSGIHRFLEIMNLDEDKNRDRALDKKIEDIKFENIGFSYGGKEVLKNLNIHIRKGEKVAFVGKSGVGKTTLLSLVKNALVIEKGRILFNGMNIDEIERKSFLEKIGVVDQNESILNASAYENLKVVKENVEDKEIEMALKLSCLDENFKGIDELKDTKLGEGGVFLSSGQKQRLALARLFLKNPDVIILDEGTSALDNILENKIVENLEKYFSDKIIIAVAHRLNSIKNFDRIFVLGEEGIIEEGSYKELLEREGVFYKMVNSKE